ncbi:MAG TPA: hypothetical protein VF020_15675 [Chthoniobacterales bacterium]
MPEPRTLSDQDLLDCIELGYGPERRTQVAEQLAACAKEASLSDKAQQLRNQYLSRLFDVSIYMKELKGRFAQWYNRRHHRYGVLWAERFKSVLVEEGQALSTVAAYIDLNPLRAGLCEDPKDYRYCGYAEAIAKNSAQAKLGLQEALGLGTESSWRNAAGNIANCFSRAERPLLKRVPSLMRSLPRKFSNNSKARSHSASFCVAVYAILPMGASSAAGPLCRNKSPAADKLPLLPNPIAATGYASLPATRFGCSAISVSGRSASLAL